MSLEIHVKCRVGPFALSTQLSLNGGCIGLLGKSGAGKSVLLGLLAGTIEPLEGYIALDGKVLFDSQRGIALPREHRPVGTVLQTDCTASATVEDHLNATFVQARHQRRPFTPAFLAGILELQPIHARRIGLLSAGERQRVALASALLKAPKLLLLDETFAVIGDGFKMQLLPILERLQNEFGIRLIYVHGISIQNQIKGRICALIPCAASLIVQIDFGGTLLAEITPGACRELALQEGDTVYCLIKTHAIVFLADLDHLPYQRVIRHDDGYYYLESPSFAGDVAVRERMTSALQA